MDGLAMNATWYNNDSGSLDFLNLTNNGSSPSTSGPYELSPLWRIGLGIMIPIICVLGIVGNGLSLVILREKNFAAVMFIYVRWMAFSDLLGMLVLIAEALNKLRPLRYRSYAEAVYFAHLSTQMSNALFGCSSLLVVLMTVERYLSVCHPLRAKVLSTKRRAHIFVVLVYVICFATYAVNVNAYMVVEAPLEGGGHDFRIDHNLAYIGADWYDWYNGARAILLRFMPFVIILVLNIFTVRSYRQILVRRRLLTRPSGGGKRDVDKKKEQEENNVIVILVSTAVVYVVCLAPMPVAFLLMELDREALARDYAFSVYLVVGNNLEVLNSALNFYMYCLACREFRCLLRDLVLACQRSVRTRLRRGNTAQAASSSASAAAFGDATELEPLSAAAAGNGLIIRNPMT